MPILGLVYRRPDVPKSFRLGSGLAQGLKLLRVESEVCGPIRKPSPFSRPSRCQITRVRHSRFMLVSAFHDGFCGRVQLRRSMRAPRTGIMYVVHLRSALSRGTLRGLSARRRILSVCPIIASLNRVIRFHCMFPVSRNVDKSPEDVGGSVAPGIGMSEI